ncbi:MAG: hypothetical protein KDB14_34970 [Planctomycetales bacterium]|nr:hypothetical protein [Planctomycetales bacterium]
MNSLQLDAATVLGLADHFERMKAEAARLEESIRASSRGFFTPSEDEQVRHLLISYWKARNALFELASSLYRLEQFPAEQQGLALSVAYAGALVLVDAARFLRERFHDRPIVRQKLNESDPMFGIPAGAYDIVQRSLTSSIHAWRLYHAAKYFAEHANELRDAAQGNDALEGVLELIPRLQHRLDVSIDRFVLARLRVEMGELRTQLGRGLLARALYGLQKLVSQLMSEKYLQWGHRPQLPADVQVELKTWLQPGDVIVTRKDHALTNYFLPGYWPHAALYLGTLEQLRAAGLHGHEHVRPHWRHLEQCDKADSHRVLEALKDGVRFRGLSTPLTCDAVTVIRPRLAPEAILAAIARGSFHAGKPYDFDFDFTRSDRLVCTEVVYRSYEGVGPLQFALTRRAGRLTLSAEDLLEKAIQQDGFETVVGYCPSRAPEVVRGEDVDRALRATMAQQR